MMKKKILFAIPSFKGGGAERVMINLANNLDKNKYQVYLMVINGEGPYKKNVSEDVEILDLETIRLRYSIKKIVRVINEVKPHSILSTLDHLNIVILALKKLFKSKPRIIIRLANTPSQLFKNMIKRNRIIMKKMVELFYPKADLIIAQCEEMQKDFLDVFPMNNLTLKYIYNPIDIKKIKSSITERNPYNEDKVNFLGVGRLSYQKGFDILIRSFEQVSLYIPNAELTILGEGELKSEYLELVNELGIEKKVNFIGFVDNPYDYYYYSDVYVLSSRFEGFPNSLLEALACNAQVVATSCQSGPAEILESKYGVMADVEDVNSLSDAMITAYREPNMSNERANYFDIDKITDEYERILLKD